MRNTNRIPEFLNDVEKIWVEKVPDWRFGQLMINFLTWSKSKELSDPFYWEEDKFLAILIEYLNYNGVD